MCCSNAKWKREVVQDHKFDFVDVHEYRQTGFFTRLRYAFVYIFVIKSVLVYVSDIYTAIAMLANGYWAGNILDEADDSTTIRVPFTIGKWIFVGCIIFSFLLLAWETRKARMIIKSRDISYAFTNIMANDYYSMKSYDHFCFFSQINNSKKKKDEFAFFVFFTFKGWKRLLLADAPRQVINGLTLYSFGKAFNFTTNISMYYNDEDGKFSLVRAGVLCTMIFTVVIWVGSAILLTIAAIMYIPLLCYIQGNLKEYCCHKIDKRIAELMKRKTKRRVAREAEFAKREAAGDFRHLQDKNGRFKEGHAPLPQPTLPTINLDDDELYGEGKSEVGSSYRRQNSQKSNGGYGGAQYPGSNYPPPPSMPDLLFGQDGYSDPYGQYQQRYQLSDGGYPQDSSYSLSSHAQQQPNYPYPSQRSLNHLHANDSFASFNDDKMSIRSKDPLIGMNGGQHDGDVSQLSLHNAPSYHTQDDDHYGYAQNDLPNQNNPSNSYGAYDYQKQVRHSPSQSRSNPHEPDPQHPYAEPPYVHDDSDFAQDAYRQQQYLQQEYPPQQDAQYPPHTQQYHQHPREAPSGRGQQPQHQLSNNPTARGVSVAGRSEISTMYVLEDRDRRSVADSHMGAFDLDDYARASMMDQGTLRGSTVWAGAPAAGGGGGGHGHGHGRGLQRRGSNLDYLEEVNEEYEEDAYNQQQHDRRQQDHRR